ncbi:NAD(P)-binding protein [Xylariaceae sp. FL1651]|nr:NAD(P)-binding protein [Xylariaceae sp. FL1651]
MTSTFDSSSDIPSLEGKVIFITGANSGLGKKAALELAKHNPAQIWMAVRNIESGEAAASEIKSQSKNTSIVLQELDLTSFESIKTAARAFLASAPRLDILFLNAGLMGAPPAVTKDGYEIHMGVNHLGHALLLKLLVPLLVKTAADSDVRVISTSSIGYKFANPNGIQFDALKKDQVEGMTPVMQYTQSKLANLLYARQVAKHYPQFTTVSVHPGTVMTNLFTREPGDEQMRHVQTAVAPVKSIGIEEGIKTHLWAATSPHVKSGMYYEPVGVPDTASGLDTDGEQAEKLWQWTQKELEGIEI